ncbi:LINE-1 type transposase domain-containing protein 1 [Anabarilius grahami]|uniref:LINE-1 type transposase domain-containing protein 1 n=1 Tax=Anabarilius grahami TaxID=495550 RepID=A0A3N0YAZ7_ANAGA|nr:LINE-1 type transposase domain-containing protein 1 [Anabarilius grahami]
MPRKSGQKGHKLSATSPPPKNTSSDEEGADGASETSEILKKLEQFRAETAGNFNELKQEVSDINGHFGQLKIRMDDAEERIALNEDREMELTKVLFHMMCKQKQLEDKCEDLESRARRKNLRIYLVPEKTEGNDMNAFLETLFRDKRNIQEEIHIERAHRATSVSAGRKEQARSIIVRFRSYKEKQRVLQAAWSKKDIRINDRRIYFDEDFTADVYRERTMYRSVRKQLQERNIKSRICKTQIVLARRKNKNLCHSPGSSRWITGVWSNNGSFAKRAGLGDSSAGGRLAFSPQ